MKAKKQKVAYEKTTYTSFFNVEPVDAKFEQDIYKALKKLRYGDGRHYLRNYNGKICRIEFVVDDEYYAGDDFGNGHAEEIAEKLSRFNS